VQGKALYSLAAPGTAYDDPELGKDPQPVHMRDYVNTREDSGGVHTNSGIPNRAFYLIATALGGYAWEKAGRIWYATVQDRQLQSMEKFRGFARLTFAHACNLFGVQSDEAKAVKYGWDMVGIRIAATRRASL
jgi:Zn-dependent metalloprotease